MVENGELETWAKALEASGDYRVLRKLEPLPPAPPPLPDGARTGLILDVETTGLDHERSQVIELAMVKFAYSSSDEVLGLVDRFQSFRDPGEPLDAQISAITGITNEMVRGQAIGLEAMRTFIAPAAVVIAHNAAFDRQFAEKLCQDYAEKPWACSMSEPPWSDEGLEGRALPYLAMQAGFFYEKHRAMNDCLAVLELLRRPLPVSGRTGLAAMLEETRTPRWRLWAHTPYELRETLKARGYRWSSGEGAKPRAWYIDVTDALLENELAFLHGEIGVEAGDLIQRRVTARERYSNRV